MYENPTLPLISGPYTASWDSLSRVSVPLWYQDAKFGIFIHWGVYSVPAFGNEWYPRNMYLKNMPEFAHHVKTWGTQDKLGYKDFIPLFKAEHFDAGEWAKLFKDAGAKYVVPVAEHHDGFAMYATDLNRWNAVNMGPKRDVIGELSKAIRAEGMIFGVSNHRAEHWWYMNGGMEFDSDVKNPEYFDFYGPAKPHAETPSKEYKNDWLARACELVDRYQPDLCYFDTWIERPPLKPFLRHFAAHYYNRAAEWGRGVVINYKNDAFAPGTAVEDVERGQLGEIRPNFWQSDTAVGKKSWCHIEGEDYKTAESIVCDLVDIVSKNGTLLLNIGPKADGTIPAADRAILAEIGAWLKANGDAIYGSRPWTVFGEGPTEIPEGHFTDSARPTFTAEDFRFTTRGRDRLFAICLGHPRQKLLVRSLGTGVRLCPRKIADVRLLGVDQPIIWTRSIDGLQVELPDKLPTHYGVTIAVTLA